MCGRLRDIRQQKHTKTTHLKRERRRPTVQIKSADEPSGGM